MTDLEHNQVPETIQSFESRKADHIRASLDPSVQSGPSGFDSILLSHEALPEIDFSEVSTLTSLFRATRFEKSVSVPFFVSSMTAGHGKSRAVNERLAAVAERRGWAMGVGSQRRELTDPDAAGEWRELRVSCPNIHLFGNIGVSQLITSGAEPMLRLAESLRATAMIVHLNPLQEVLQLEGTPKFRGGLAAIESLVKLLSTETDIPVVVKETGCGISGTTAKRLMDVGVSAIDVAGRGGTHWGRVEGLRSKSDSSPRAKLLSDAADSLRDWGISTVDSLEQVVPVVGLGGETEVWASGGVRSGVDGAKALALGASAVGIAQPLIAASLVSESELEQTMARFEFELKTVLFCSGCRTIEEFQARAVYSRSSSFEEVEKA